MKQLIAIDGTLYFPDGGRDFDNGSLEPKEGVPSLLFKRYYAGDIDTIAWPLAGEEWKAKLASALFDERECNPFFNDAVTVKLPDGSFFDIAEHLRDDSREEW